MANDLQQQARPLIDRLRQRGQHAAADQFAHHVLQAVERGSLLALRETCETLLTAVEAIDPVTQTMVEELRVAVERRLNPGPGPSATASAGGSG